MKDHPLLPGEHASSSGGGLRAHHAGWCAGARAPSGTPARLPPGGRTLAVSARQQRRISRRGSAPEGSQGAPLVLVQAGNKRTMRRGLRRLAVNHKYWPTERWAAVHALSARRAARASASCLLGTGPEYALNQELMRRRAYSGCLYNAADDLPIPRLTALLRARLG